MEQVWDLLQVGCNEMGREVVSGVERCVWPTRPTLGHFWREEETRPNIDHYETQALKWNGGLGDSILLIT